MLKNYKQIVDKYSRKLVLDNPTMDIEASTNKLIKAFFIYGEEKWNDIDEKAVALGYPLQAIKNASVFAKLKNAFKA